MLTIPGHRSRYCDGLSRRTFLQIGGLAFGGLSLPQILRAEANQGASKSHKSVIMILLPGGPSHLDMYDLKPEAPAEIRGEFNPIRTNVSGIEICELMPRMARMMDKLIPIRSLVGAGVQHNMHQCLTGWASHPQQRDTPIVAGFPPGGWPSIGAVISKLQGTASQGVPPAISVAPSGSIDITRAAVGQPGYLGIAHSAFEINELDPGNVTLQGVTMDRLADRRALLKSLDRLNRNVDATGVMDGMDAFTRQAFGVVTSGRMSKALDLEKEDPRVRRRYGIVGSAKPKHGGPKHLDQFLLARRVIEAGARCVTAVFTRYPLGRMSKGDYNWDWHRDNFNECRATLPMLDQGISALVEDLDSRGMLDDISIVVWGEFGRTPKINGNAGRDHWPSVAGALLAGGGMQTGQVIGSTNRLGERAKEQPVDYLEVLATLYRNMGIDVSKPLLTDLSGRPRYITGDFRPIKELA